MSSLIYYNKQKMEKFKEVFRRIDGCPSCKLRNSYFSIGSKTIITTPLTNEEIEFNKCVREAYSLGYNNVIFSFSI